MSEARPIIPLDYATPKPKLRRRFWPIPANTLLDVAVALVTAMVNLMILGEIDSREAPSSFAAYAVITLEAIASIAWAGMLLRCAVALMTNETGAARLHRIYAGGKLLLALMAFTGAGVLVVQSPEGGAPEFAFRIAIATLGGMSYALMVLRYFCRNTIRPLVRS